MVCIHAVHTVIVHEKWTQVLPEISECSDGVVVDLTPPLAGKVWIGSTQGLEYQVILRQYVNNNERFLFFFFLFFFYMYSQLLFFKLCEIDVFCYFLQTAASVLYVNWESFQDVEEFKTNSHASGIQNYKLGIGINHFFSLLNAQNLHIQFTKNKHCVLFGNLGTSVGGNDAVDFFDVGVVNHKVLNGIALENGRAYYATVIGT